MSFRNLLRIVLLIIYFNFSLGPSAVVCGERPRNGCWKSLETKYTVVHYKTLEDIRKFDSNITFRTWKSGVSWLYFNADSHSWKDELSKKIDALYVQVQSILDMRKRMENITINLYHDKKQLHAAYREIYKRECQVRAWYTYENNAIFLNVDDIHEGILAHEIAHSIIDHYLLIRPPQASAEILCRYVETHLFK